jgi:hypothetical protein
MAGRARVTKIWVFQTAETTKPSYCYEGFVLYGAGTRNRTRDLLITSPCSCAMNIGESRETRIFRDYFDDFQQIFLMGVDGMWTLQGWPAFTGLHRPSMSEIPFSCLRPNLLFRSPDCTSCCGCTKNGCEARRREGEKCLLTHFFFGSCGSD